MKRVMSASVSPWSRKKRSASPRKWRVIAGTSDDRTTRKPLLVTRQPITSSLFG
jgi:hypothetical protein